MFACFDQPDLKATFEVEVTACKNWKVISNSVCINITEGHTPSPPPHV